MSEEYDYGYATPGSGPKPEPELELPAPCTCAIACYPAITSIMGCAEHGMPQNLDETEFPGSAPKIAVILWQPNDTRPVIIAPLYTDEQVQHTRERAETLGLRVATSAAIYSLADLDRIEDPEQLVPLNLHSPGCIYAGTEHPGRDCYVERPHASGCTGKHAKPSEPGVHGQCIIFDKDIGL